MTDGHQLMGEDDLEETELRLRVYPLYHENGRRNTAFAPIYVPDSPPADAGLYSDNGNDDMAVDSDSGLDIRGTAPARPESPIEEISRFAFHRNVALNDITADFHDRFPWLKDVDFNDPDLTQKDAQWYLDNRDPDAPELDDTVKAPPAIDFLNKLISVDVDELTPDQSTCGICAMDYFSGEDQDIPVKLPCGHIFGKQCLWTWLSEIGDQHNTCPMCRTKHVELKKPIDMDKGLKTLLGTADYLLTRMGPLRLDAEGRQKWQGVKDYVNEHLKEEEQKKENERQLGAMIAAEWDDSVVIRSLGHLMTPNERDMLRDRLRIAFVEWDEWRNGVTVYEEEEEQEVQEEEVVDVHENDDGDDDGDDDMGSEESEGESATSADIIPNHTWCRMCCENHPDTEGQRLEKETLMQEQENEIEEQDDETPSGDVIGPLWCCICRTNHVTPQRQQNREEASGSRAADEMDTSEREEAIREAENLHGCQQGGPPLCWRLNGHSNATHMEEEDYPDSP